MTKESRFNFVSHRAIRAEYNKHNFQVSDKTVADLDLFIDQQIQRSIIRAEANKRKRVTPYDLD